MRIIRGEYGGRIFKLSKKFSSRPTTDIAKEGLFNILDNRFFFKGKNVLDLFAGTGSIGYEFLSRGCHRATFVEKSSQHIAIIRDVAQKLKLNNVELIKSDAFLFLKKSTDRFYFIFADPPFDLKNFEEIPNAVFNSNLLDKEGLFIIEHPSNYDFSQHPSFREKRNYGKVNFSFFEHKKL